MKPVTRDIQSKNLLVNSGIFITPSVYKDMVTKGTFRDGDVNYEV